MAEAGEMEILSAGLRLACVALEVPANSPRCHVGQAAQHWRLSAHERIILDGAD